MNKVYKIEERIISLLTGCLCLDSIVDHSQHPIVFFEASKSIIGLNIDNPCLELVDYLENYNTTYSDKINYKENNQVKVEMASIFELKSNLVMKDYNAAEKTIYNLINLSDGRGLMEYMIEISLLQTGNSLKSVWPIYKAMNFIGYDIKKDVFNALVLSSKAIIYDKFISISNKLASNTDKIFNEKLLENEDLILLSYLYEIKNSKFIRSDNIELNYNKYLCYFTDKVNVNNDVNIDKKIKPNLLNRTDLIQELLDIGLNENSILTINSIRAYMKNTSNINYHQIAYYINSCKDKTDE